MTTQVPHDWIRPDWPAPATVHAVVTTRQGGASRSPWDSFNPAAHVGDDPQSVAANRQSLQRRMGYPQPVQWMQQVHGTVCHVFDRPSPVEVVADAAYTRVRGLPLAVMTADCLSVFFCDRAGTEIAVAHAGWRGLCGGVLEATLDCFEAPPEAILAWLGPAIGPQAFQVGPEVRDAFLAARPAQAVDTAKAFQPDGDRFLADIFQLARLRLQACDVGWVGGGSLCTASDPLHFFSYRRDGVTGRMASVIALHQ